MNKKKTKNFKIFQNQAEKIKSHEDVTSTRLEKYFKTKIKNFSIPSFYFNYRVTYCICVSDTSTCVHIDIRNFLCCGNCSCFKCIVWCVTCDMVTRMLHVVTFKKPKIIFFFIFLLQIKRKSSNNKKKKKKTEGSLKKKKRKYILIIVAGHGKEES